MNSLSCNPELANHLLFQSRIENSHQNIGSSSIRSTSPPREATKEYRQLHSRGQKQQEFLPNSNANLRKSADFNGSLPRESSQNWPEESQLVPVVLLESWMFLATLHW